MSKSIRPLICAGIVGAVFMMVTAWAYYCWCKILVVAANGYVHDFINPSVSFFWARICLGISLVIAIAVFEMTHRHLLWPLRMAYAITIGLAFALFVVPWIIRASGFTPFWHEP